MPKTTKKSKASKANGLKKRFDLNNKRVQFFVVVGIVALLGGGWFTYKSFAAEYASVAASVDNGKLRAYNGSVVSDSSKGGAKVIRTGTNGSALTNFMNLPPAQLVRYCYTARASKPVGAFISGHLSDHPSGGKGGGQPAANTIIGTSYSSDCTNFYPANSKKYVSLYLSADVQNQTNPDAVIYTSLLYAEYIPVTRTSSGPANNGGSSGNIDIIK